MQGVRENENFERLKFLIIWQSNCKNELIGMNNILLNETTTKQALSERSEFACSS